jgi:hypothetical protein
VDLSLTMTEFLPMTPRLFCALLKHWGARQAAEHRAADLRAGIVAATIANGLLKKQNEEPFVPADFMPGQAQPEEKKQELTAVQRGELELAKFRAIVGA